MPQLYHHVIGGALVAPERSSHVIAPYDGEVVGIAGVASPLEVERALEAGAAARPAMAALPAWRRSLALRELEHALAENQDELASLICAEAGKPIRDARREVQRGLLTVRTAAEEALRFGGEAMPLDFTAGAEGRWGITRRFPLGLIAGVTPFNFPLNLVLHKLAPALAAGNSIVVKASPRAPLTALRLGELALGLELPPGAVNVLAGGAEPVEQLLADGRVALLSFTGSAEVGWRLNERAGRRRLVLELGGNAANIVHSDADLPAAAAAVARAAFGYAGQSCISAQRVFVHRPAYEEVRERLVARARALRLGDPAEETTDLGPMITPEAARRAAAAIAEARAAGAVVLCGGACDGGFLEPTVLENVPAGARVCREEAFAPLLVLAVYDDFEQALARANASRFGLQAGVFTRSLPLAWRSFEVLEVGAVLINQASNWRIDPMPYGGVKDSGRGREGVRDAMESMSEPRLLVLG